MASTPSATDFIISQGDTLPLMRIVIPANSGGQLLDLQGCTVTFLGRKAGTRSNPPPISRQIQSFAQETEDGVACIAVYVKFATTDITQNKVPVDQDYLEMQGELEIKDGADVLTVPSTGYIRWFIRDDIGDGT